jgi:alpha-tubulin suppressor-like RCC1 family protein
MNRIGVIGLCLATAFGLSSAVGPAGAAGSVGTSAWGHNEQGELGNGTTTKSDVPVSVSGLTARLSGVSAGSLHSLALLSSGTVMAWGANGSGQLGNGSFTGPETCPSGFTSVPCSTTPVAVSGLSAVSAVSAGGGFSVALLSNGTVKSWGSNFAGALGNGTTADSNVPVTVKGLTGVKAVSADGPHAIALLSDGTVVAWGDNEYGQLGDGTSTGPETCPSAGFSTVPCSRTPVPVSGLSGVTAISAGDDHNLALLSNGTVVAWGANNDGQLGDGSTTDSSVPVPVGALSGVTAVSAGGFHSLALLGNGTVMAWGDNGNGQLGDGTLSNSAVPVAVSGVSGVAAISAGLAHSLAQLGDGTVKAWGWNNEGQLGDGVPTGESTVAVPVSGLTGARFISAGGYHSLAYSPPSLPEVGRCVKVAAGAGIYQGAACVTKAVPGKGRYEWIPVSATEKQAFTGAGAETTLATVGHPPIHCVTANISGEYTGPKTATVQIEFQACTNSLGQQCQSNPQNKSELKTLPLEAELGLIKNQVVEGRKIVVAGLDLKPQPPLSSLLVYECGSATESARLEGSVIGKVGPINKMTTTMKLLYYAKKTGEQVPERFESGLTETLTTTFQSGLESTSAPSTLNIKEETGSNAAPLEIKAKCEGPGC